MNPKCVSSRPDSDMPTLTEICQDPTIKDGALTAEATLDRPATIIVT